MGALSLEELQQLGILVVSGNAPGERVRDVLKQGGFHNLELVRSPVEALSILRRECRHASGTDALVLIADELLEPDVDHGAREFSSAAAELGAAVILLATRKGEAADRILADARSQGLMDIVCPKLANGELFRRIALCASWQLERSDWRAREAVLQADLAERRVMAARYQYLAFQDELTGLGNRRRIDRVIELVQLQSEQARSGGALLVFDIDHFRVIAHLEGRDAADRLLTEIAHVLDQHAGAGDTVARIGTSSFAWLLRGRDNEGVAAAARRLREALEQIRLSPAGRVHRLRAAIGIAPLDPAENNSPQELMARARFACRVARAQHRDRVRFYDAAHPDFALGEDALRWVPMIREALENDWLEFEYQPVVRLSDGTVMQYELLLRMRDAAGHRYAAEKFMGVAERTGLVEQLDMWVVEQAVDRLARMPRGHGRGDEPCLSVNLSGAACRQPKLWELLNHKLQMTSADPKRIIFEVAEDAVLDSLAETCEAISRLHGLGFRIALDDFGGGVAAQSALKTLPVDFTKLAGGLLIGLQQGGIEHATLAHVVDVARRLGCTPIAKSVEHATTLDILREIGVELAQGQLLAPPGPEPSAGPKGPDQGTATSTGGGAGEIGPQGVDSPIRQGLC